MPMPTAQRVAPGVGARRAIYCVGNGVWVTFAMSVALVWPFAPEDGYATAAGLVNRGCFALAFLPWRSWLPRAGLETDTRWSR